jgi:hypothetical protein
MLELEDDKRWIAKLYEGIGFTDMKTRLGLGWILDGKEIELKNEKNLENNF